MLKKLAAAAAVLGSLVAFGASADAKTHVFIGVGAPGWGPGYGFYDGPYYGRRSAFLRDFVTCKDAAWDLRMDGWRNVKIRECRGFNYTFTGTRGYQRAVIHFNGMTGRVVGVRWLR